jgi:sulfotransferase family protein
VFIVAAPRSGSTLLFETLAASEELVTVGGEAHWLVEGIDELRVGAPGVDSNRLSADVCSPAIARRMQAMLAAKLQDSTGHAVSAQDGRRFLEKTPKNSLRIPFFEQVFPEAQFIFLWRDPRENLSSIIEAWRSGNFRTYPELDGFEGAWSLVLPPGWRQLTGRPLEEIAAFQWESANRIVLDDLALLPARRWTAVRYADLIGSPQATIERLCEFLGMDVDPALRRRLEAPLPPARYTHTPPAAQKWQMNAALIERVLPRVAATWQRLQALR